MYTKEWIMGLSLEDQLRVRDRMLEGSIDYMDTLTLDQACRFEVRIEGELRSLAWVAQHRPKRLELLMDTTNPGSVLFSAIALVYNAHLDKVLVAVDEDRHRLRDLGMVGLAKSKESMPKLTPRPITALRPRPLSVRRPGRVYLKPHVLD